MSKAPEIKLKEGDKAPEFTAPINGGGRIALADFKGKHVVLYFYPRDDTPGCTKEAGAFRDHFTAFKKKGAVVLGVSVDSVKAHDKFADKFKLPFTLVSDEASTPGPVSFDCTTSAPPSSPPMETSAPPQAARIEVKMKREGPWIMLLSGRLERRS